MRLLVTAPSLFEMFVISSFKICYNFINKKIINTRYIQLSLGMLLSELEYV